MFFKNKKKSEEEEIKRKKLLEGINALKLFFIRNSLLILGGILLYIMDTYVYHGAGLITLIVIAIGAFLWIKNKKGSIDHGN